MKKWTLVVLFSFAFLLNVTLGQSFANGDLEGTVNGISSLPFSWQPVPFSDVNCMATDYGLDSPDLLSATQPFPSAGYAGVPYSGSTFVAGSFTSSGTLIWHEGIQQLVNGFTIGEGYEISLYQANVKTRDEHDTTGNWMVIVDDSIIGVTEVTVSYEPYNNFSLNWERRLVQFEAWNESHTIKFLPFDDDTIRIADSTYLDGGLSMGIDNLSIYPAEISAINDHLIDLDLIVYPNPNQGEFKLGGESLAVVSRIRLFDPKGVLICDKQINPKESMSFSLPETPGLYFTELWTKDGTRRTMRLTRK